MYFTHFVKESIAVFFSYISSDNNTFCKTFCHCAVRLNQRFVYSQRYVSRGVMKVQNPKLFTNSGCFRRIDLTQIYIHKLASNISF